MQVEIRTPMRTSDREELFELLFELGYEPHDVPPVDDRSAGVPPFVIWFAEHIGAPAALLAAQAVARFLFRKHGSRATKSNVKVIYGPNDEKLAEVPITEDEE
jgi:hypothetical protein